MSEYDWSKNLLTVNGQRITGFGEGTDVIALAQPDARVVHNVMVDGHVVASAIKSRQCTWTLKLRYNSSSNATLRARANIGTAFPVRWVEPDGTVHFCQNNRVSKVPDRSSGSSTNDKVWELMGEELFEIEGPGVP